MGQTLRLAGILHCALRTTEPEAHEIDGTTMNAAVTLAWYFLSHAKAVFTDIDMDETISDARDLYRRIQANGRERFTKTDLYRLNTNLKKSCLEAALGKLILGQYIFIVDGSVDDKRREYALLADTVPPDRDAWQ